MRGLGLPGTRLAIPLLMLGLVTSAAPVRAQTATIPLAYECSVQLNFALTGPYGVTPSYKTPRKPKRPTWQRSGAAGGEQIAATARVGTDGTVTNLYMYWMQAGLFGWPQVGRADLDDIALQVRFGEWPGTSTRTPARTQFDPALLSVEVRALETRKMKRPRLLTLRRSMSDSGPGLGGLADIPAWLLSASIYLDWPELERFAGDRKRLDFSIEEIVFRDGQFYHDHVRGGALDLSVMPQVIERFREAEALVKAKAANPRAQCVEAVAAPADPGPEAEI